jgi:hypothetical protein
MTDLTPTTERVPDEWSAADEAFFRVVRDVLAPTFLAGAGVLLASYDHEVLVLADARPDHVHPLTSVQPLATDVAEVAHPS